MYNSVNALLTLSRQSDIPYLYHFASYKVLAPDPDRECFMNGQFNSDNSEYLDPSLFMLFLPITIHLDWDITQGQ